MTRLRLRSTDIWAGLTVAGLLVPQAVAYATIAGLQTQHAIIAAIAGLLVYAMLGRSNYAITAPTSSSAAILAATVATFTTVDATGREAIAFMAVSLAGGLFILAGLARLGSLSSFISRPVLNGFAFGLAVTIVARQVPSILGVKAAGSMPAPIIAGVLKQMPAWNAVSLASAAAVFVAIFVLGRWRALPAALIVLAGGIAATYLIDFPSHGVSVVGIIRFEPSLPQMPHLSQREWSQLVQFAIPLALIIFAESWGSMRTLALRHGERLDANRELFALGVANVVCGLARGMPVGSGLSVSAPNEAAGASSRAAGVVAAFAVAALIGVTGNQIARLPEPVLAAVVVTAMAHSLNPAPLARLWKMDRDQYIACGAALGVMIFGVLNGMLLAILLSVAATLRRLGRTGTTELGRLDDTRDFIDITRHPEARTHEAIGIFRPNEPLFFFNAEANLARILGLVAERPAIRAVILSLEDSADLDSTAIDAIAEFEHALSRGGRTLYLARLKDEARSGLIKAGLPALVAPDRCFWSVWDAYTASLKAGNIDPAQP